MIVVAGRTYSHSSIGHIIRGILRDKGMEDKYHQAEIQKCYEDIMGTYIAKKTRKLIVKDKKLIIYLDSGVLKEEFSFSRSKIPQMINEKLGENLIEDVEIW